MTDSDAATATPVCPPADLELVRRLTTFLFNKNVRGPLTIEARSGTVTLRGLVGSFYHRQLLIHGARRVAGVMRVVDELEVAPGKACS